MEDISKHKLNDERLMEYMLLILKSMTEMVFLFEVEEGQQYRYALLNDPAKASTGLTDEVYGKRIVEVLPVEQAEYLHEKFNHALLTKEPLHTNISLSAKDNIRIIADATLTPIYTQSNTCTYLLMTLRDNPQYKLQSIEATIHEHEDKYHYYTNHSQNPTRIWTRLSQMLAHARREEQSFTLLLLKCHNYNLIKETVGYAAGEQAIIEFIQRIQDSLRIIDTVNRVGADECIKP